MKKLLSYFLQGLLYLAPIGITIYIIFQVFVFSDDILQTILEKILGMHIPGLGLLIMLLLVTSLGYVGQTIIARPFKVFFQRILHRLPLIELIYSAINDFFSAVVGKEKKFNKPVIVRVFKNPDIERIGFITEDDLKIFGLTDKIAVLFPFSYTFSGEMLIVPVEDVTTLDLPAREVMKFIASGGVAEVNPWPKGKPLRHQ
jgi:uncharacterized membrane protein